MLELIKILPNILAQLMSSLHKPFYSNLIYSFGYLIFIHHNIQIQDQFQFRYFIILEIIAVGGVVGHVYKMWKAKNKEMIN